jgi:arylsulfatase
MIYDGVTDPDRPFDEDRWELYHVAEDFSESQDLAGEYPDKLRQLQEMWWREAGAHNVLPLDARGLGRGLSRPRLTARRNQYVYYPGGAGIEMSAAVNIKNRAHTIVAEVDVPAEGADGVLAAQGGRFGGYSFYVKDGTLRYAYNFLAKRTFHIAAAEKIAPGPHKLKFDFEKTGGQPFGPGGTGRLYVDDTLVAEDEIPRTVPFLFSLGEYLQIGLNESSAVSDEYEPPFAYGGTLHRVIFEVESREPPRDIKAETDIALARQ